MLHVRLQGLFLKESYACSCNRDYTFQIEAGKPLGPLFFARSLFFQADFLVSVTLSCLRRQSFQSKLIFLGSSVFELLSSSSNDYKLKA